MLTGTLVLVLLATLLGLLLGWAGRRPASGADADVQRLLAALPQIQCAQCGYPGCRPYAEALAAGNAATNLCPPGGPATAAALAHLLGREQEPLPEPAGFAADAVAVIDEALCIGCARCLPPCPVDAIVGAPRFLHTIIAVECTGCGLCLPACPVDCISMAVPVPPTMPTAACLPSRI
jgi:RnfABCDGE-type electron transport complex B subunit